MPAAIEERPPTPLRHIVVIWAALFGVLIDAFVLTVSALNSTVYSASGFVNSYLHSLQRGDLTETLSTPGVRTVSGVSDELLTSDALSSFDEITILSDVDQGGGLHVIKYRVVLDGTPATGTFEVLQGKNRFAIFSTWSFLQNPISELQVTPMHDAAFSVNGIDLVSLADVNSPTSFQVFTPSRFTISHDSTYLTATPVTTTVTQPGSTVPVTLDIRASPSFVKALQTQMDGFLDDCATQEVLFPTGCPFGQELSNRVESVPDWSIASYPVVTIEPGSEPGTWVVPEAQAAAHLTVDVRSLFDGSVSTFDEDITFGISWMMTITGDRIDIQK